MASVRFPGNNTRSLEQVSMAPLVLMGKPVTAQLCLFLCPALPVSLPIKVEAEKRNPKT